MFYQKTMLLVLALAIARTTAAADEHKIALVTELNKGSGYERSLELFPDTLDVEVQTDEGAERLHLVRQKSLNVRSIPVEYDSPELNQRQFKLTKDVAYYQDLDKVAPIRVEATFDGGVAKRTLTGTMIHHKRAYEIHPGSSFLQSVSDILEEKGLGPEHQHTVHVLKKINIRDYLRPDRIKLTPDQEEKRRELETKAKEEQTLKTFLRLLSADTNNKQAEDEDDLKRSKRYASHSITTFHVEMLFIVDYSVYIFWMNQHNNDAAEVHEALVHYYANLFNGIHMSYRRIDHAEHNIAIILWLVKLHVITNASNEVAVPKEKYQGQAEEDEVFDNIKDFQIEHHYNWTYPDHIMLWTKSDLGADYDEDERRLTADLLGVAYMCKVCHPGLALSQNEDNGFFSWATGAHELGHNLGSNHDGTGGNSCPSNDIYLMYISDYTLDGDIVKTAFEFSDCSIEQFRTCFTGNYEYNYKWPLVCVYDTVCEHNVPMDHVDDLPGQLYNLTQQCQLFVDPDASAELCEEENVEICEQLECYIPSKGKCTSDFPEFRAAPGTPCNGNSSNSVCTGEDCVCYEGRCLDTADIKTQVQEQKPSCSEAIYTPPEGCEDDSYSDCIDWLLVRPYRCFTSDYHKEVCKATCYELGLFYFEEPPCAIPGGSPVPETGTSAEESSSTSGVPEFCQQTHYGKEGGMTCPYDPTHCIPMSWFCDGEDDCDDGSDEDVEICIQVPCSIGKGDDQYLRCRDEPGYCYKEEYQNDNFSDCSGNSDEDETWGQVAPRYCFNRFSRHREGFNCPNNPTRCVKATGICDGRNDCDAAEGEMGDETIDFCESLDCMGNQLRCTNEDNEYVLKCIKTRNACNGVPNCPDGSDEQIDWCMSNGVVPVCDVEEALCPHQPTYQCVARSKACDFVADCEEGGDEHVDWCEEEGLLPQCPDGEVMCPGEKFECIPRASVCDGTADCPLGGDEKADFCLKLNCPEAEIACPGEGAVTCIPWAAVCDKVENCPGGGDEESDWCAIVYSTFTECDSDEVICPNAEGPDDCIRFKYACDHMDDCNGGGDEDTAWCLTLPPATCKQTEFRCILDSYRCIRSWYTCDDYKDCLDGSDESPEICGEDEETNEVNNVKRKLLVEAEQAVRKLEISRKRDKYRLQREEKLLKDLTQHTLQEKVNADQSKRVLERTQKVTDTQLEDKKDLNREEELRVLLEKLLVRNEAETDIENDDDDEYDEPGISENLPPHTLINLKKLRETRKKLID